MKQILKMLGGLLIGIVAGLLIAAVVIVLFTDTSFSEYITKLRSVEFSESMVAAGVGLLAFCVALVVLIPIHELGHLVCGLLTGYRFVSFRIFNYTFIKINGKVRMKKFAIAGTGGQCLLDPPEVPYNKVPMAWYNAGGVLANLVVLLLILPLLFLKLPPLWSTAIFVFFLVDVCIILINGIPMQVGGVGNDAYNMLLLRRSPESKRGIVTQLRSNAMIQNGVRPKDMPEEWFEVPANVDYKNVFEVTIPLMAASRHIDEMDWDKARGEMEVLYGHRDKIMPLYVKEIACELVYLLLISGETARASELLDKDLKKYIETYRKVMSSKERLLCAVALLIDNDRAKALEIYENLKSRKDDYLLQGEVKSDLALMEAMLNI
ncbi:MAG: M50 family metallopeptidase [Muribaculaceae bacterium]|nr:M50 family metallopeptidase [Muribaculaceae bacterium]